MAACQIDETSNYIRCYPDLPQDWKSDTNFYLGWISGLQKVANESLTQIYGDYDNFKLNRDDILDFEGLNPNEFASDSVGPIIYVSIWAAILVLIAILSVCWCCCNKCCCCCRSSFKGRNGRSIDELENTDPNYQLRPYYSERNDKKFAGISVSAIVLSILMALLLIGFLIMILHTFASNGKTKNAIDRIQPDLENAFEDINKYLDGTRNQLSYMFQDAPEYLETTINKIADTVDCPDPSQPQPVCDAFKNELKEKVASAMSKTVEDLLDSSTKLNDALKQLQTEMNEANDNLKDKFEDTITDANNGLHWFFMICNVLYCIVFGLVLIGTVLATFGIASGLKTTGYLLLRGAIVLMFILAILAILQLITMFLVAGITSRIICPAIRELESLEPVNSNQLFNIKSLINATGVFNLRQEEGGYEVPNVDEILRACKRDESAYLAFKLEGAYDIAQLKDIPKYFDELLQTPINREPADDAIRKIQDEVQKYVDFVEVAILGKLGNCAPAYNAINATISLFCDKVSAPVASFWWILQFIPPTFILMFITAMFSERLHV